jgi:beta-lactamase class A
MGRCRYLVVATLLAVVLACGNGQEPLTTTAPAAPTVGPSPTAPPVTATVTSPPPTAAPAATASPTRPATPDASLTAVAATPVVERELPDSPVGQQLAWVLEMVNADSNVLTPDAVQEHFAPAFLKQLPVAQTIAALRGFAVAYGPVTFDAFLTPPTAVEASAVVVTATAERFIVSIAVAPKAPHRITGLFFQPEPQPVVLTNWPDLDGYLTTIAPEASVLVAELGDDGCRPIHAVASDLPLAVGSTFKLYVLGELARQIEAGTLAWEDELALVEEWKSLPSGIMQDEPAGTAFTLQQYATQMIAISDNTATDHLIHLLGRERVEEMQGIMGHHAPDLNVPFLMTREMFVLKLALPETERDAYLSATPDERRELLRTTIAEADLALTDAAGWTTPRAIEDVEWFASANDLCTALGWLHAAMERPGLEPLRAILSQNPGIPLDATTWTWAGFKGGSEPGVLNLSWLLERADGRQFVVTASFNDPSQPLNEAAAIELLMGTVALLGTVDGSP